MEVTLKYLVIRLDSVMSILFMIYYFGGGVVEEVEKINISERVSILSGVCFSIYHLIKTYKIYFVKDAIADVKDEIIKINERIDSLENNKK